jgi:hypothetical protein
MIVEEWRTALDENGHWKINGLAIDKGRRAAK